jgi:tape measure domain-containing protein
MSAASDLMVVVGANISAFQTAFQAVSQTLDRLGDEVEKAMSSFEGMGARMAAAGSELSAAISIPILDIGKNALETAAKFEQTQIAFEHFIGSAQGAKDYLKQLYDFAANTPFQIQDITGGAQKLMAMGFAARDVIPMLKAMGDQLSAVGRMDMLPNLILAFGELKEGGVASMRALRQMVMDGVIPALKYMAEAAGVSAGEMRKQIMHGAVDSEAAMKTILAGMARDTGGLMASEMSSFSGMMTNVKDNITYTLNAIGQQLLPVAKSFADFATSVLNEVKVIAQAFGNLPEPVRMFGLALAGAMAAAGPLLVAIGGLVFGLAALNIAFAPIAGLIGISTVALAGYAAVAGVVIAAVAALAYETKTHWAAIKAVTIQAFQGISEFAHAIFGPLIQFLESMFKPVAAAMVNVWTLVKGELSAIWNSIRADAEYIWGKVVSAIHMVVTAARLIPGVNKLLGLGEAWESADKLAQSANKAAEAVHKMGAELKGLPKGGEKTSVEAKVDFKPVTANIKEIEAMGKMARAVKAFKEQWTAAFQSGAIGEEAQSVGERIYKMGLKAGDGINTLDKALKLIASAATAPLDRIADAFKTLGVESSVDLKQQAADAKAAYDLIAKSGTASAVDIERAWVAMEEAKIKAAVASGKVISEEEKQALADAKKVLAALQQDKGDDTGKNDFFSQAAETFQKSLTSMLDGTKKLRNAWKSLGIDLLQNFGQTISELVSKWAVGMAKMLLTKVLTDAGIVKSHAQAAAQTQQIDTVTAIKKTLTDAKSAATGAYQALVGIPIIGPIIAPPAAVAAFAAVMALGAVSAEGGAVLPNYNTIGMLHPNEMVLPAPISMGLQNMIANGGGKGGNGGGHTYQIQNTNNFRGKTNRTTAANAGKTVGDQLMKRIRNNGIPRMR